MSTKVTLVFTKYSMFNPSQYDMLVQIGITCYNTQIPAAQDRYNNVVIPVYQNKSSSSRMPGNILLNCIPM